MAEESPDMDKYTAKDAKRRWRLYHQAWPLVEPLFSRPNLATPTTSGIKSRASKDMNMPCITSPTLNPVLPWSLMDPLSAGERGTTEKRTGWTVS